MVLLDIRRLLVPHLLLLLSTTLTTLPFYTVDGTNIIVSFEQAVQRFGLDVSKYTTDELTSYKHHFKRYQEKFNSESKLSISDVELYQLFQDSEPLQTEYEVKLLQEKLKKLGSKNQHWNAVYYKSNVWGQGSDLLSLGDAKKMQGDHSLDRHKLNKPNFNTQTDENHMKLNSNVKFQTDLYTISNMTIPTLSLPSSFDSRQKWGDLCPSLTHVRNQGACGSCWAHGSTEAFNDRVCIGSNGKLGKGLLSTEHTTSCCDIHSGCFSFGCQGGGVDSAWWWLTNKGVVTGGDYGDDLHYCWPYDINPKEKFDHNTPRCRTTCENSGYQTPFDLDLKPYIGGSSYSIKTPNAIKENMFKKGPVSSAFTVYKDFMSYSSGVYTGPVSGSQVMGGHAIKMVGWGETENSLSPLGYWIVQNSWGSDWGIEGYFWIEFGSSTGIEDGVIAGDVGEDVVAESESNSMYI